MAFTDVRATENGLSTERVEFDARVIENNPERSAEDPAARFWINSDRRRFRLSDPDPIVHPGAVDVPRNSPAAIGRRLFIQPEDQMMGSHYSSSLA